jgi:hypothetical protein
MRQLIDAVFAVLTGVAVDALGLGTPAAVIACLIVVLALVVLDHTWGRPRATIPDRISAFVAARERGRPDASNARAVEEYEVDNLITYGELLAPEVTRDVQQLRARNRIGPYEQRSLLSPRTLREIDGVSRRLREIDSDRRRRHLFGRS